MKVTKVEEQSLRLAMGLARHGGIATLGELARNEDLSEALVAKILGRLRRGGVVVAIRGRNGGYRLAAAPDELSVGAILGALGNPLIQGCFNEPRDEDDGPCPHAESCGLRPVWNHLESQVSRVFGEITLADLMRTEDQVRDRVARLWPAPVRSAPARPEPRVRTPERAPARPARAAVAVLKPEPQDGKQEAVAQPGRADSKERMRDES